jgi:hypothetical protein
LKSRTKYLSLVRAEKRSTSNEVSIFVTGSIFALSFCRCKATSNSAFLPQPQFIEHTQEDSTGKGSLKPIHDKITFTSDVEEIPLPYFSWPSHGRIITPSAVADIRCNSLTKLRFQFVSLDFYV